MESEFLNNIEWTSIMREFPRLRTTVVDNAIRRSFSAFLVSCDPGDIYIYIYIQHGPYPNCFVFVDCVPAIANIMTNPAALASFSHITANLHCINWFSRKVKTRLALAFSITPLILYILQLAPFSLFFAEPADFLMQNLPKHSFTRTYDVSANDMRRIIFGDDCPFWKDTLVNKGTTGEYWPVLHIILNWHYLQDVLVCESLPR